MIGITEALVLDDGSMAHPLILVEDAVGKHLPLPPYLQPSIAVVALWVLRVLAGLTFLGVGGSKLAGVPAMVEIFDKVGLGPGFRILTGALKVLGAIGQFVPRFTFYAACLLALVMIGAIGLHRIKLGGNPAPPIVLLSLVGTIAWLSRNMVQGA